MDRRQIPDLLLLVVFLLLAGSGPAFAIGPGAAAPPFELPWLDGQDRTRSAEIFSERTATVLFLWDRGCPRCVKIALSCSELSDSLQSLDAQVVGIVLGPDDPEELGDLLWDRGVLVPHLWDEERVTAGPYGLGHRHLGIFVVDRGGTVRAVFDDMVPDLVRPALPAVLEVLASPAVEGVPAAPAAAAPAGWPVLKIDGRTRLLSTEGARSGDTGLFGEELENGTLLLFRWDVRMSWVLAEGVVFEPWLRVSNETDAVLTEGPEQLSSRHGSASLRVRRGPLSGALGAFELRLSPLLLQRWDRQDAPPIGGASGCGLCGAGASGVQQHSLEILRPEYTFEGATATYRNRFGRLQGWLAVPHGERQVRTDASLEEQLQARYRRILHGGAIELGRTGRPDPDLGLPSPIGLRLGIVSVDDDQRSIPKVDYLVRPPDLQEVGRFALGRVGPWWGLAADGEIVDWTVREAGGERTAGAIRAGVEGSWETASLAFWSEVHRIRTDRWFDPLYRALTYDRNREGWRASGGVRLLPPRGTGRERAELTLFYRHVRETEPEVAPLLGRYRYRVMSLSLSARPLDPLLAEISLIELRNQAPEAGGDDAVTQGITLDLRWEGLAQLDPVLHVETLRNDPAHGSASTIWQSYLSVRFLR